MIETNEEKRIYVVVPLLVTGQKGVVKQPIGRQAAQAVHVVSKMRVLTVQPAYPNGLSWMPITTVILSARDGKELGHIWGLLVKKKIKNWSFADTNPDYGLGSVETAICTEPLYKREVQGILDYLPLWPGDQK